MNWIKTRSPTNQRSRILLGIGSVVVLLIIVFLAWMVYERSQNPLFVVDLVGYVLTALLITTLFLIRRLSRSQTIRLRLNQGFILMAIIPAFAISTGIALLGYKDGYSTAINQLDSVSALKKTQLSTWSASSLSILQTALNEEYAADRIMTLLDLALIQKQSEYLNGAIRTRLSLITRQSTDVQELFIVDQTGTIIVSTDPGDEGLQVGDQPFFVYGGQAAYIQLPFGKPDPIWPAGNWIFAAQPVVNSSQKIVGMIVVRLSPSALVGILSDRTGLGQMEKIYLVNELGQTLQSSTVTAGNLNTGVQAGSDYAARAGTAGLTLGLNGNRVVGNYLKIDDLGAVLAVEQDQSDAFASMYRILAVNLAISLLTIILALIASILFTKSVTDPIVDLAGSASAISNGDMSRTARVWRNDEVGALAIAFNAMTDQLRDMIGKLEQRVAERTQALQEAMTVQKHYSVQLEISAKVSREITSILSIDELLNRVVILIRNAFGYYNIHITLLEKNEMVMRASTGEYQPSMIRISQNLPCLNTKAVHTGKPVLANDVSQEPLFVFDPRSPNSRAELVIPLRLGDKVIGTMDVVSEEIDVFSEQDVIVLSNLSDQVSIAIENARLYACSRELVAIEERNRLARDLHDSVTQSLSSMNIMVEGWRRLIMAGKRFQVKDFLDRVSQITDQALKEMRMMVQELRPTKLEEEGLLDVLHARLETVEKRLGVDARLTVNNYDPLPPRVEEELYWITHEALNNSLRHSGATQVLLSINKDQDTLVLEVVDNGCGFLYDKNKIFAGYGLSSMSERARQIDGELQILSAPGSGTTIRVIVPNQPLILFKYPTRA